MKVKDIIKKQTTIIALAVVVVTIAVIGVSYAIFFDVKVSDEQIITAGSLQLKMSNITALSLSEPMSTSAGLSSSPVNCTVNNTDSNLPAAYSLYVYAGPNNQIELNKIKIATEGDATTGSGEKIISSITDTITENGTTYFKIGSGTLAAQASGTTKYIRLWVDDSLLNDELNGATLDIQLYLVSEVDESTSGS